MIRAISERNKLRYENKRVPSDQVWLLLEQEGSKWNDGRGLFPKRPRKGTTTQRVYVYQVQGQK